MSKGGSARRVITPFLPTLPAYIRLASAEPDWAHDRELARQARWPSWRASPFSRKELLRPAESLEQESRR